MVIKASSLTSSSGRSGLSRGYATSSSVDIASRVPRITLNTGHKMPMLGLGTFAGTRKTCVTPRGVVQETVESAVEKVCLLFVFVCVVRHSSLA